MVSWRVLLYFRNMLKIVGIFGRTKEIQIILIIAAKLSGEFIFFQKLTSKALS